jgi:hypothetical protein
MSKYNSLQRLFIYLAREDGRHREGYSKQWRRYRRIIIRAAIVDHISIVTHYMGRKISASSDTSTHSGVRLRK